MPRTNEITKLSFGMTVKAAGWRNVMRSALSNELYDYFNYSDVTWRVMQIAVASYLIRLRGGVAGEIQDGREKETAPIAFFVRAVPDDDAIKLAVASQVEDYTSLETQEGREFPESFDEVPNIDRLQRSGSRKSDFLAPLIQFLPQLESLNVGISANVVLNGESEKELKAAKLRMCDSLFAKTLFSSKLKKPTLKFWDNRKLQLTHEILVVGPQILRRELIGHEVPNFIRTPRQNHALVNFGNEPGVGVERAFMGYLKANKRLQV